MNNIQFEFATAGRIIFGIGSIQEIGKIASKYGNRALVVTREDNSSPEPLFTLLKENNVYRIPFPIAGEPSVDKVLSGVSLAQAEKCDLVIGFGGGSVIDTGKAIAAMLTNAGDLYDYLEVIGKGKQLTNRSAPFIAIPTTSGTGSEVTKNAVISSPEHHVKVSLRSVLILPLLAIIDPELTLTCPPETTAYSGMDALTQLIEPYTSVKMNPMMDGLCREGIRRVARSLQTAYNDGMNIEARQDMSIASLFGGLALANAGLGAVHGFSGVLGGMFPIPHGALCARLLPIVMDKNIQALLERDPNNSALCRYKEIAQIVTGNSDARIEEGFFWIRKIQMDLNIPSLAKFGVTRYDFAAIAEQARLSSSMKGNIISLTDTELLDILEKSL